MQVTEHKAVTRDIQVAPCLKCGGTDIQLSDSNYSSFNQGGGKCKGCGHEATAGVGCLPSMDDLAAIWNAANDIDKLMAKEQAVIAASSARLDELKQLKAARAPASNLGDRLRALQEQESARVQRVAAERQAQDEAAEAASHAVVADFFRHAQEHITTALTQGKLPTPYQLGESPKCRANTSAYSELSGYHSTPLQTRLEDPAMKFHQEWVDFKGWAAANGLVPKFVYEHDGVGVHGWYVLQVEPA